MKYIATSALSMIAIGTYIGISYGDNKGEQIGLSLLFGFIGLTVSPIVAASINELKHDKEYLF